LADEFSVQDVHTDYQELCGRDDIDAVTIVSPPASHAEQAIAALTQGKHVFCEKPLGMTVAEVDKLVEVALSTQCVHQAAFTFRYLYGVNEMRRQLKAGAIGEPFFVRIQYDGWSGLLPSSEPGWRGQSEIHGPGMLLDIGVHLFDIVRFVVAPITSVTGFTHSIPRVRFDRRTGKEVTVATDDLVSTWFALSNGVRGQWFASRITPQFTENGYLEVVGTKGALKASLSRGGIDVLMISRPTSPEWKEVPLPAVPQDAGPRCLGAMMRSFVDACLRGKIDEDVDASFVDGLAAQQCAEAVVTANRPMEMVDPGRRTAFHCLSLLGMNLVDSLLCRTIMQMG
ncbi:MAG: Gfo/Idh/MocA family protein, partial [Porticoccaceae bacterium]